MEAWRARTDTNQPSQALQSSSPTVSNNTKHVPRSDSLGNTALQLWSFHERNYASTAVSLVKLAPVALRPIATMGPPTAIGTAVQTPGLALNPCRINDASPAENSTPVLNPATKRHFPPQPAMASQLHNTLIGFWIRLLYNPVTRVSYHAADRDNPKTNADDQDTTKPNTFTFHGVKPIRMEGG